MFVCVKKHPGSQNSSVLICHSVRDGKIIQHKVLSRLGTATNPDELFRLQEEAKKQLSDLQAAQQRTQEKPGEQNSVLSLNTREISRQNVGVSDILGQLYDDLGFSKILTKKVGKTLKSVVLSQFAEPSSKRKTSFNLERHFGEPIQLDKIYRMMDTLEKNLSVSREVVFKATKQATNGKVDLILFDVTTLHFETIEKDELKAFGFSKNFRFNTTQVVLALATTTDGLPIGYKLFPGNTAEVTTLMQCINLWKQELSINKVVVVGDRGMMSKENIKKLEESKFEYIIAYPMKKSSEELKEKILSDNDYKGEEIQNELYWKKEIEIKPGQRLIVTYSHKRHIRDKRERDQLIEKIKKKLGPKKRVKNLVSNQGYLNYTKIDNEFVAELNEKKILTDSLWDGLHGVLTNSTLSGKEVIEKYKKLWIIEEAFRINKHQLKMRPMYHYTPRRIATHIDICFLTFALLRHAQDRLKKAGYPMSVDELRDELTTIAVSILCDLDSGKLYRMPSCMSEQARAIYKIFGKEKSLQLQPLDMTSLTGIAAQKQTSVS